jgi:predicted lipoprotein with Yx(FWY)xxD motif
MDQRPAAAGRIRVAVSSLAVAANHRRNPDHVSRQERTMRQPMKFAASAIAASVLLAACGSNSTSQSSSSPASSTPASSQLSAPVSVVMTVSNPALGGTILVNAQGMTLYHLGGEQNGKWICTSAGCVGAWHPLTAATGTTPKVGAVSLGTIKRPDGTMQLTYKGMPLYTFAQDQKPGDAKGQGLKDVGTWTAVTTTATARTARATSTHKRATAAKSTPTHGAPATSTPAPVPSTPAPAPSPPAMSSGGGGYGY